MNTKSFFHSTIYKEIKTFPPYDIQVVLHHQQHFTKNNIWFRQNVLFDNNILKIHLRSNKGSSTLDYFADPPQEIKTVFKNFLSLWECLNETLKPDSLLISCDLFKHFGSKYQDEIKIMIENHSYLQNVSYLESQLFKYMYHLKEPVFYTQNKPSFFKIVLDSVNEIENFLAKKKEHDPTFFYENAIHKGHYNIRHNGVSEKIYLKLSGKQLSFSDSKQNTRLITCFKDINEFLKTFFDKIDESSRIDHLFNPPKDYFEHFSFSFLDHNKRTLSDNWHKILLDLFTWKEIEKLSYDYRFNHQRQHFKLEKTRDIYLIYAFYHYFIINEKSSEVFYYNKKSDALSFYKKYVLKDIETYHTQRLKKEKTTFLENIKDF